jgi:hypothetical protein
LICYSPRVSCTRFPTAGLRRVYTRLSPLILLLVCAWVVPSMGQDNAKTPGPAMVKGPADAPVKILEFSDYQ